MEGPPLGLVANIVANLAERVGFEPTDLSVNGFQVLSARSATIVALRAPDRI
jgi:hypothetical protein